MVDISAWDHVGLRVFSLKRSLVFYEKIGFRLEIDHGDDRAYEIVNKNGIRINLIVNATYDSEGRNLLLDEDVRHPGCTHPAFIVESLDKLVGHIRREGIQITEGPKEVDRRRYLFIRDPDGNVLEFNEIM